MTKDEILKRLNAWEEAVLELDAQFDPIFQACGGEPEAPLPTAVNAMIGAYTHLLADHLDWDYQTLEDWWYTHKFGEHPMQIGLKNEPLREIRDADALAQFIFDDHKAAELAEGKA